MEREYMEIIGVAAGCCTTAAFAPQVVRTWKTKSVEDISLGMYCLLCLGVVLWIAYGSLIGSLSVVLSNMVIFVLAGAVLVMKLRFGRVTTKSFDKNP
jgi:MtN3 and saliva related transmembrane protein